MNKKSNSCYKCTSESYSLYLKIMTINKIHRRSFCLPPHTRNTINLAFDCKRTVIYLLSCAIRWSKKIIKCSFSALFLFVYFLGGRDWSLGPLRKIEWWNKQKGGGFSIFLCYCIITDILAAYHVPLKIYSAKSDFFSMDVVLVSLYWKEHLISCRCNSYSIFQTQYSCKIVFSMLYQNFWVHVSAVITFLFSFNLLFFIISSILTKAIGSFHWTWCLFPKIKFNCHVKKAMDE